MWWAFVIVLFTLDGGIAAPAQIVRFPVQPACEQARESMARALKGLPALVAPVCVEVTAPGAGEVVLRGDRLDASQSGQRGTITYRSSDDELAGP